MRITLLRAPAEPDYKADRGEHDFVYSLYPHAGTWAEGGTVKAGFGLNVPADLCEEASKEDKVPASFVAVEHSGVVLDTFKKAENGDGYILRLYEACGSGGKATIRFAKPITALSTCDMMEQGDAPATFDADSFSFETSPYCIHTYRVRF